MSYLICTYGKARDKWGNIRDHDVVTRVEIAHFTDIATPTANKQVQIEGLEEPVSPEVWECMCLIHQAPDMGPVGFDPVALIKVVNTLRQHGKETVIHALTCYRNLSMRYENGNRTRYSLAQERIYNICYLLFSTITPGLNLPRHPGPSSEEAEANRDAWPMFPLVVVDDIPFYLAQYGFRTGAPLDPLSLIRFCDHNCSLRAEPMSPKTSPIAAVERLYGSPSWRKVFRGTSRFPGNGLGDGTRNVEFVREQALRCLRLPAYAPESFPESFDFNICANCVGADCADKFWEEYTRPLRSRPTAWDVHAERFTMGQPEATR